MRERDTESVSVPAELRHQGKDTCHMTSNRSLLIKHICSFELLEQCYNCFGEMNQRQGCWFKKLLLLSCDSFKFSIEVFFPLWWPISAPSVPLMETSITCPLIFHSHRVPWTQDVIDIQTHRPPVLLQEGQCLLSFPCRYTVQASN